MTGDIKLFEECIEKIPSTNKIQRNEYLTSGRYPIISQEASLINGYWDNEFDVFKVTKPVIVFGDHTRVLKFVDFDFVLGADGAKIIKPKDFLDSKYFYYLLLANPINDKGYSRHYRFLKNLRLLSPPLATQRKIVEKLDAIFAEIDNAKNAAEANVLNAEAIFNSYLNEIFTKKTSTFIEKRFDEVCTLQRGFDLPTQNRKCGEFKLVSANGVTDFISEWKIQGPCVVTGRSGTIGKVHYVEENFWPLNTTLFVKDFFGNYEKYIYYFLIFFKLERYVSGAGVPTLNRNFLSPVLVHIESDLKKQKNIVKMLDELFSLTEKLKNSYLLKLNQLSLLKHSILRQAFNSELVKE